MARRIVFLGNCQMGSICTLYQRFIAGVTHDEAIFLPSWTDLDSRGQAVLAAADVLVEQVMSFAPHLDITGLNPNVRRIPAPLVAGTFLWPFAGGAHPANAPTPFLPEGPFPGEVGDAFLARMVIEGISPEAALEQYRAHDLGGAAGLNRRYEIIIDQQRRRDEVCDFSIAPLIEQHFRSEQMFISPHHPELRLTLALAAQLFFRLGAPARSIDMLTSRVRRTPFPLDELPIHPRVAAHFKLPYVPSERTYAWRGEGHFTWEEWVLRYMRYAWIAGMHEAWSIATTKPAEARGLLEPVLATAPNAPTAHAGMAKSLLALRELEPAALHAAEAIRQQPQIPEYYRLAGAITLARGHLTEAEEYARAAVHWDAGDLSGYQFLAKVQDDMGHATAAEATRREALDLRPDDPSMLADLGTALLNQKRYEEALQQYQRSLALNPTNPGALFGASLALAHLSRTEEAVAAVEQAIRQRPGVSPYHSHHGHQLARLGRHEEALAAFRTALALEPHNAGLHSLVADMLLKDQMALDGLYHAQRAMECEPRSVRHQIRFAGLLARHVRLAEAIAIYRKLIDGLPTQTQLHIELAALYVRLDRLDEALGVLDQAMQADAGNARVAADRAAVLLRMGRPEDAESSIRLAQEAAPDQQAYAALRSEIDEALSGARYTVVPARYLAAESEILFPAIERVMPACIRYTNFPDVNPTFGAHHVDHLYVEKLRWMPAINLCRLPAGTQLSVPTSEEFIAAVDDRVVAEQVRHGWSNREITDAIASCTKLESIDEPAVLIGRYGIRTWGHWLGELLPIAVTVEARWPGRFKYIVPDRFETDPVHTTAVQSLAYYGISTDRLRLLSPKTQFACANLHVVTPVWSADRLMHPMVAELMRERGFREQEPAPGWLNVALLRRSTRTRKIANLPAIERTLMEHGFTVVDIESLTFTQQVNLFRNAKSIACVLGSGLSGLFYAPRGVKVLTMAPAEWGDLFFFAMIQERDAAFADVRGPTLASQQDKAATSEFVVPMEALNKGLTAIGFPRGTLHSLADIETRQLAAVSDGVDKSPVIVEI